MKFNKKDLSMAMVFSLFIKKKPLPKTKKPKCRCYINAKYYARQAKKGGNLKGYIPCPIHEKEGTK